MKKPAHTFLYATSFSEAEFRCNIKRKTIRTMGDAIGGSCPYCGEWFNAAALRTDAKDPFWLEHYKAEADA